MQLLAHILQAALSTALIGVAFARIQRSAWRRRGLVKAIGERSLLVYPSWVTWLGVTCAVGFATCAWLSWGARTGGPLVSTIFLAFTLLGVVVLLAAWAEDYTVDAEGIERRRFASRVRLTWSELARITAPGPGLRLVTQSGRRLDCPAMLDGFGVLCDHLLQRAPRSLRVDAGASNMVLAASTLAPEVVQQVYAAWFEREECAPPSEMTPEDLAEAAGVAFAARLLDRQGSLLPFESRWTRSGALQITHGEPHRGEPGFAAFRIDDGELVIASQKGEQRWPLSKSPASGQR